MLGGETERHKQRGSAGGFREIRTLQTRSFLFLSDIHAEQVLGVYPTFRVRENASICPISLKNHNVAQRASSQVT